MTRAHLTALALPDMDHHPLAVDVADLHVPQPSRRASRCRSAHATAKYRNPTLYTGYFATTTHPFPKMSAIAPSPAPNHPHLRCHQNRRNTTSLTLQTEVRSHSGALDRDGPAIPPQAAD
jgi:hypothetical protein